MRFVVVISLGFASLFSFVSASDTVNFDDRQYADVYVIETARAYYVCLPDEGRALSVAKSDPSLRDVSITSDSTHRAARYAEFKARKVQSEREEKPMFPAAADTAPDFEFTFEMGSHTTIQQTVARPKVPVLRLKGEPRAAPPELQAIINANLGLAKQYAPGAGGGGGGGGNIGGGGASGGAASGASGAGGGGLGASGGGGGAGGGGAGGGAGGGRGGGGVAGFRNISELFTNIDDAEVGETPNPITGR